ncbi:MAG: PIN domain-containing protein [Cyanobacteriota bacterium]
MTRAYRIYMDVCCLNRPFDSWQHDKVRFEAEAVLAILRRVQAGEWQLISSEAIEAEINRLPNREKLENIRQLLNLAAAFVTLDEAINRRSQQLENWGFGLYDSFHLACAEAINADILLTTDQRLIKRALRYREQIQVRLNNPILWLVEVLSTEEEQDHDTD